MGGTSGPSFPGKGHARLHTFIVVTAHNRRAYADADALLYASRSKKADRISNMFLSVYHAPKHALRNFHMDEEEAKFNSSRTRK